ncbi:hypothetical protein EYF80_055601 [Liparis tanakae]|uniref:Uncharacterized protein n=1 Tax=Liparis tanakae TaxID=230148 RepID=A0A4Z2F0Q5_9TELE|nr:hypothetical protein EYF80_055601 [Liparis tanakae]
MFAGDRASSLALVLGPRLGNYRSCMCKKGVILFSCLERSDTRPRRPTAGGQGAIPSRLSNADPGPGSTGPRLPSLPPRHQFSRSPVSRHLIRQSSESIQTLISPRSG